MFLIAGHAPHVAWTQLEPPRGARCTRRTPICNLFDNDYAVAPHIDCRYVAPEPIAVGVIHVQCEIVVLVVGLHSTQRAGLEAHKLSDTLCERRRADLVLPRRSPRCDDGGVQSLLVMDPIQRLLLADLSFHV